MDTELSAGEITLSDAKAKKKEDQSRKAEHRNIGSPACETATPHNGTTEAGSQCRDPGYPLEDANPNMGPLDRTLTTIERREIVAALKRANGQRTLAARLLGISRSRLYRRMEALGINPREIAPRENA